MQHWLQLWLWERFLRRRRREEQPTHSHPEIPPIWQLTPRREREPSPVVEEQVQEEVAVEGEMMQLEDWLDPEVPQPVLMDG